MACHLHAVNYCIKMADAHNVNWEIAGKAEGTEPLCFL